VIRRFRGGCESPRNRQRQKLLGQALRLGIFRAYYGVAFCGHDQLSKADVICLRDVAAKDAGEYVMDTNTLLIILVVIFLFGGFGFYGRGRWF
jgi:hypothetical protein